MRGCCYIDEPLVAYQVKRTSFPQNQETPFQQFAHTFSLWVCYVRAVRQVSRWTELESEEDRRVRKERAMDERRERREERKVWYAQ